MYVCPFLSFYEETVRLLSQKAATVVKENKTHKEEQKKKGTYHFYHCTKLYPF